jgi:hypothetical protein
MRRFAAGRRVADFFDRPLERAASRAQAPADDGHRDGEDQRDDAEDHVDGDEAGGVLVVARQVDEAADPDEGGPSGGGQQEPPGETRTSGQVKMIPMRSTIQART